MRNLNWLDKYRRTDKELEIAGCTGDEGNGVTMNNNETNASRLS